MNKEKWHVWFAWYPVKIGEDWIWFKSVYRKCTFDPGRWENSPKWIKEYKWR